MVATSTDRIEKKVLLRAPRARVWRALTNAEEFGKWFGVEMAGRFAPGARVKGKITHKGYEHVPFEVDIERMEPEKLFSWRWHPGVTEPNVDYSTEPKTLVVFQLEEVPDGTMLTVVETGFDQVPLARRAAAYRDNDGGWEGQMESIERYVAQAS
jgi:uncharacterized protein YndB with AHSA1/START domain